MSSAISPLSRRGLLAAAAALPAVRIARAQSALRVVVVGGGWGGLSAARQVRTLVPNAEVTLVEPNRRFMSCPLSIHYIVGDRSEDSLTFGLDGVLRTGVRQVAERAEAVDRAARVVVTATERLPYDFLVLSPGIEYMEEAIPGFAEHRARLPVGFRAFEQQAVKAALDAYTGGDIVLSVPPMPFRCPIAPYERAALFAEALARRNLPGKVILLDQNPAIPIGGPAITAAFAELHAARLEHHLGVQIASVDGERKRIETNRGALSYGMASLIPPMRAGGIVRAAGLGQRWADVRFPHFLSAADERIYVIGDAVGSTLPKSGHLAVETGVKVAGHIADRVAGRAAADGPADLPSAICFAFFNAREAMGVRIGNRWDDFERQIQRQQQVDARRSPGAAEAAEQWSRGIWAALLD
ncbi:MAG: FAD/NAD(P)-binding oxidoreductase [Elioraea tepidiphila]